jgi:hypothetical protein
MEKISPDSPASQPKSFKLFCFSVKKDFFARFLSMCEFKPYEGPAGVRNYPTPRIIPAEYFGFGRPRSVALSFHGAPGQFKD